MILLGVKSGELYQADAVRHIQDRFGAKFWYTNESGNPAIAPNVLKEFRRLSEKIVVWEPGERLWRLRTPDDEPGRRQD